MATGCRLEAGGGSAAHLEILRTGYRKGCVRDVTNRLRLAEGGGCRAVEISRRSGIRAEV